MPLVEIINPTLGQLYEYLCLCARYVWCHFYCVRVNRHMVCLVFKCTQQRRLLFLGTKSQHDTYTHSHACTHTHTHKVSQQSRKKGSFPLCVTENEQIVTLRVSTHARHTIIFANASNSNGNGSVRKIKPRFERIRVLQKSVVCM